MPYIYRMPLIARFPSSTWLLPGLFFGLNLDEACIVPSPDIIIEQDNLSDNMTFRHQLSTLYSYPKRESGDVQVKMVASEIPRSERGAFHAREASGLIQKMPNGRFRVTALARGRFMNPLTEVLRSDPGLVWDLLEVAGVMVVDAARLAPPASGHLPGHPGRGPASSHGRLQAASGFHRGEAASDPGCASPGE